MGFNYSKLSRCSVLNLCSCSISSFVSYLSSIFVSSILAICIFRFNNVFLGFFISSLMLALEDEELRLFLKAGFKGIKPELLGFFRAAVVFEGRDFLIAGGYSYFFSS